MKVLWFYQSQTCFYLQKLHMFWEANFPNFWCNQIIYDKKTSKYNNKQFKHFKRRRPIFSFHIMGRCIRKKLNSVSPVFKHV